MPSTGTAPTGIDRGKCSSTGTTPEQQQQLPLPPPQAITTAPSATLSTTGGGSTNVSSQRKMRSNGVASPPKHGTLLSVIVATSLFLSLIQLLDPLLLLHQPPTLTPVDVGLQDFQRGHLLLHNKLNLTHEQVAIGREPIIDLLHEAGVYGSLTPQEVHLLPKWHHVIDLYGTHVRVVGKERCEAFRQRVPHRARKVGVAGMFNTGTNLLDIHLHRNVQGVESLWQVPWGKHRMPQVKWNHTAQGFERTNKEHVLPVVMVRDPLSWLQSMCRTHYAAHWRHNARHCPNLIPTEQDRNTFPHLQETFNVSVHFDTNSHFQFDSLAHFWSEYHLQYMNVDYPILFIRFEDLVFQPRVALAEIADCLGATLREPLHYQVKSSKGHGSGSDFFNVIMKTADSSKRLHNLTMADRKYLEEHLDPFLMDTFGYRSPLEDITNE